MKMHCFVSSLIVTSNEHLLKPSSVFFGVYMRFLIALLLVSGGSIAAFALSWFFFSMQNEQQAFEAETASPEIVQEQNIETVATLEDSVEASLNDDKVADVNQPENAVSQADNAKADNAEASYEGLPKVTLARIGPDGSAVIAGIGAPLSIITVKENGEALASGKADDSGEWVIILEQNLSAGNHLLTIEMLTASGILKRDQRAVLVEIEQEKQEKPLVALVPMQDDTDGETAQENAQVQAEILSVPESFNNSIIAQAQEELATSPVQPPLAEQITPLPTKPEVNPDAKVDVSERPSEQAENLQPEIFVNTLSWQSQTALQVNGNAQAGESVQVQFGASKATARYSREDGTWAATVSIAENSSGILTMQANLRAENGKILASTQIDIDLVQLEVGRDGSEMVVIKKGDMLWRIAYRTYGQGIRYLDIVKQNKSRIDDPDMIFPAQIFTLPQTSQ